MKKMLLGKKLEERAKELGVSFDRLYSEAGINEPELQKRVLEAERSLRESRLWQIALTSSIASVVSAIAAWFAVGKSW